MRKICIITGTRADYGLLYWLMKEIQDDPDTLLQVVVTGMHLSPEFGLTYQVIEQDGFTINSKVEMLLSSDTSIGIAKSMGLGVIGFAEALDRLRPDIMVVLGDRYEILAAAQAAMVLRIPIAHIHGGEATEGLIDEAIRHSVTKMAHLHFVAAEPYKRRVIQLGEHPKRVYNFGAIGLDNLDRIKLLNRDEFEKAINFSLGELTFLVTFHPVTLDEKSPFEAMKALFGAITSCPAKIIFTKPNADTNCRIISQMIDEFVANNHDRAIAFTSMGQLRYLSAIKHVDMVIGNSSSGLIEVPAFRKATINIGSRQAGRLKAASVIDCDATQKDILCAINKALAPEFRRVLTKFVSPYGLGNVSCRIKKILKEVRLEGIIIKKFFDFTGEL